MAIFVKMSNITGNVNAKGYEGWVQFDNLHFAGISNGMSSIVGRNEDRVTRYTYIGEISAVKTADKSSIKLFEHAHSAKVISDERG